MKESHREGLATHPDPESCGAPREGRTEALTGAHVGRVLSRERTKSGVPTAFTGSEGNTPHTASSGGAVTIDPDEDREVCGGSTRSETPRMHGNSSCGNRESSGPAVPDGGMVRSGKSKDAIPR